MKNLPVYLDYNATTPVDPGVLEAMLPYFTVKFGNAASKSHMYGWIAEEAVDLAREKVAELVGASEKEIVFTSGATEANNLAIKGIFEAYRSKGNHIITCQTEHKAVLDVCKHLEQMGARVTYLPVRSDGLIDLENLRSEIGRETILVAIMFANNETGVIQPIKEIAKIVHEHDAIFFSDATQAVGKIPVDVEADGIDLMSFSGHKLYAPKGIGALYVRRRNPRVRLVAQIDGGGHERGMRSGTLNVPSIVGLGKACELGRIEMNEEAKRLAGLRDHLEGQLISSLDCSVNGNIANRMPHVSNIAFANVNGQQLLMELKNVALSSGSACTSASLEPSYVLKSMGIPDELAHSSIRFSLGRFTSKEEIDQVAHQTIKAVGRLHSLSILEG